MQGGSKGRGKAALILPSIGDNQVSGNSFPGEGFRQTDVGGKSFEINLEANNFLDFYKALVDRLERK